VYNNNGANTECFKLVPASKTELYGNDKYIQEIYALECR
jgi:hypothetical protein